MANEINISISIQAEKNGAKYERQESFKDDMAGDAWTTGVADIADSSTQITDLQITNYGWIFLKNLGTDTALYIDFAHTAASLAGDDNICRLYGGESCVLKSSAETGLFAISSSGIQAVEYAILEV